MTSSDQGLGEIVHGLLRSLPQAAGTNGAQVEWFLRRIEEWSADDWFFVAAAISKPGIIAAADDALGTAQTEGERSGYGASMQEWGGTAYTAAKMVCAVHAHAMVEGVGKAAALIVPPSSTQEQLADVVRQGLEALTDTVKTAAVALAYRPLMRPELFLAMWAPFEVPLNLMAGELGVIDRSDQR